jgi:hypothetical protein
VRIDSPAHSVSLDWGKTILATFQFFAFLHSLGHERPIGGVRAMSAYPPIVLQNSFWGCVQNFPEALVRSS